MPTELYKTLSEAVLSLPAGHLIIGERRGVVLTVLDKDEQQRVYVDVYNGGDYALTVCIKPDGTWDWWNSGK